MRPVNTFGNVEFINYQATYMFKCVCGGPEMFFENDLKRRSF